MPFPAHFVDAHHRYWDDARLLFDRERWANADQLYGFSAECGLKAVMQALGMRVDEAGKPREREHQEHVPRIWLVFKNFVAGRDGAQYARLLPEGEPFADWSHHDRYAHRRHFNRENVERHREAAGAIRAMVHLAEDEA
jgi:hypothetical protein